MTARHCLSMVFTAAALAVTGLLVHPSAALAGDASGTWQRSAFTILAQTSTGGGSKKWIYVVVGVVVLLMVGVVVFVVMMSKESGPGGKKEHAGVRFTDTQVDEYRLINLMMTGQTSQVYEVAHVGGGQHFAMKMLLPEHVRNQVQRELLYHEADVGKEITHPKIIRILSLIQDKHHPYFLMEFFPSTNLKLRLLKKDPFVKENAQKIIEQAALALAFMNDRGWVHRDVKPDNILVNASAEVRLIDFALAQRIAKKKSLFRRKAKPQGTRSYMSPEQIRAEPLDARADIYSFGVTLYEIMTGRPPFRAASPQELLNKQVHEKPASPKVYNQELSDEFCDLVVRMLAKKREDRPPDFHAFLQKFRNLKVFKAPTPKKPT